MKKKGFTLIELLAVIIILAIVALVATPIILNVVNDAKKSAGLSETKMIYSGINNYCEEAKLKEQLNGTESICKDGVSIEEVNQMVNLGNAKVIKLTYTNKVTELTVESNGYTYTLKDDKIVLDDGTIGEGDTAFKHCIDPEHPNPQPGDTFIDGQLMYKYGEKIQPVWNNAAFCEVPMWGDNSYYDGWGVHFNDSEATDATIQLCSTINGKPLVSVNYMFMSDVDEHLNPLTNIKLKTVKISNFDTSHLTDGLNSMFAVSGIEKVDLGDLDTSNVTNMNYMFASETGWASGAGDNIKEIVFGDKFDTSKVTSMRGMFAGTEVTNLNLSNFDTSKVEDMHEMFFLNRATTINFGNNFNTSNVTDMSDMFNNSSTISLDLSNFDTSKVTDMNSMFWESKATTGYARNQADADKFNDNEVTKIPNTLHFEVKS